MTGEARGVAARTPPRGWLRRAIGNPLEALAVWALLGLFGWMNVDRASALGGALGRTVGPWLPVHARARVNLARAFPDMSEAGIKRTLRAMWDNLGRVTGEIPHLGAIEVFAEGGRVEVVGVEHLDALAEGGIGGIVFSAHLGSWDLMALALAQRIPDSASVYRPLNNPIVNRLVQRARAAAGEFVGKGASGARSIVQGLRAGRHFAMLVDQKMNDGIPVPFFGRDAMTAPALARFAIKENVPLVPCRCERLGGARFRLTYYPQLPPANEGNMAADIAATMAKVNALLETWIAERPEQWLWVHNRWPD